MTTCALFPATRDNDAVDAPCTGAPPLPVPAQASAMDEFMQKASVDAVALGARGASVLEKFDLLAQWKCQLPKREFFKATPHHPSRRGCFDRPRPDWRDC